MGELAKGHFRWQSKESACARPGDLAMSRRLDVRLPAKRPISGRTPDSARGLNAKRTSKALFAPY
jgi:hypothetical protein